ncbi:Protein farnesyltransferase subunit beta [Nymphon striatum]|nr:Protein farnesyltransferase subunit beta [Nymphon striatum]
MEKVEKSIETYFTEFADAALSDTGAPQLFHDIHKAYLMKGLTNLHEGYECLDSSRPWLCYWILHSLELLDEHCSAETASKISGFLKRCQSSSGGFGGSCGPEQHAHLATTYASVCSLCILGTEESFSVIDRPNLYKFLMSMKTASGSFQLHHGGEEDVSGKSKTSYFTIIFNFHYFFLRGTYCALVVASLTNILTPELIDGTAEWIVSCQTYEGGFGGVPGMEAHGGYSFCGLAGLVVIGRESLCDLDLLLKWAVNKQMRFEGGFQGRTNKLVDGCYSFWQGGIFPLIHRILSHNEALQEYLLICCQNTHGGLVDKPGKARDYYHTCYGLSGLTVAQHFAGGNLASKYIVGDSQNELAQNHPVFNVGTYAVTQSHDYFKKLPVPKTK